jgi:hypothetical protein
MEQREQIPIRSVENAGMWFICEERGFGRYFWEFQLRREGKGVPRGAAITKWEPRGETDRNAALLTLIRELYDMKIGQVATRWEEEQLFSGPKKQIPIQFEHAKIKLGDVFDYYTSRDGVLQVPNWLSFKFAVEEYLANDPKVKFHPSRVRDFIEQRGLERLEEME